MATGGDWAPLYLVECFSPGVEHSEVEAASRRATDAVAELRQEGHGVAYEGALVVVDDEVVFHLFSGASEVAVRHASERAAIDFERILETLELPSTSRHDAGLPAPVRHTHAHQTPSGRAPCD